MLKGSIIVILLVTFFVSCSKRTKNYDYTPNAAANPQEKIVTPKDTDYAPTNPDATEDSTVVDKIGILEHEQRIHRNIVAPIVLGQAAGNISLANTYAQGLSILSNSYSYNSSNPNELTYYEQIWVNWGVNKSEGRKAQSIRVMEDYQGALVIDRETSITMGEDLGDLLDSDEKRKDFANRLVQLYYNDQITDCIEQGACLIKMNEDGSGMIQVVNSILFFSEGFQKLQQLLMLTTSPETDPEVQKNMEKEISLLTSAAGIDFTMSKGQVEELLHSSGSSTEGGETVYEENVWLKWENEKITSVRIMEGYLGSFFWPEIGDITLGSDIEEFFLTDQDIAAHANDLYHSIIDSQENCVSAQTCLLSKDSNDNVILYFKDNDQIALILFFEGSFKSVKQILIFPEVIL